MKQGLNEADHRFLTFFAFFAFWLGIAQSELKGRKFQRLGAFVFWDCFAFPSLWQGNLPTLPKGAFFRLNLLVPPSFDSAEIVERMSGLHELRSWHPPLPSSNRDFASGRGDLANEGVRR
jgi:hypothetical protein